MIQSIKRDSESMERPVSAIIKDIFASIQGIIQSEFELAKAEMKDTANTLTRSAITITVCAVVALAGMLPILSFFVIGLGRILNDNYWLSSLIVGIVMISVGLVVALGALRKLRSENLTLPRTRKTLEQETNLVKMKLKDVAETTTNRRAS